MCTIRLVRLSGLTWLARLSAVLLVVWCLAAIRITRSRLLALA